MKNLIITDFYYRGGLETYLYNLLDSWEGNDQFIILCNEDNPSINSLKKKISKKKLIDIIYFNKIIPSFVRKLLNQKNIFLKIIIYYIFVPLIIVFFKIFFIKNNFDKLLVVNGGYPGSILCRCSIISWRIMNKKKSIFNIHNMVKKITYKNFIIETILDFLITQSATHIITVSKACLKSFDNRLFFKITNKKKFIYNGLKEPKKINNFNIKKISSNEKYLLMLATFERRKGYEYLFQSVSLLKLSIPNINVKIFGYGSNDQYLYLLKEIKKYNLENNIDLGYFQENAQEIINNCKIMLVPSQEDESFGYTIIEAMALGKPIIATDTGGMPEVLTHGSCGFICSKYDPNEFADSIKDLISNKKKYENFSINCINRYKQHFISSKMSIKYKQYLA